MVDVFFIQTTPGSICFSSLLINVRDRIASCNRFQHFRRTANTLARVGHECPPNHPYCPPFPSPFPTFPSYSPCRPPSAKLSLSLALARDALGRPKFFLCSLLPDASASAKSDYAVKFEMKDLGRPVPSPLPSASGSEVGSEIEGVATRMRRR